MNSTKDKSRMEKKTRDIESLVKIGAFMLFMGVMIALQALTSAEIDPAVELVSPLHGQFVNTPETVFDFYVNFNATECRLVIGGILVQSSTNETQGFGSFMHNITSKTNWSIECDSTNGTIQSDEREITLDQSLPTIVLFTPQNNQEIKNSDVQFNFVALDNYDPELNCTITLSNNMTASSTMNNSVPGTISMTNISNGNYTWKATCMDDAENYRESEERQVIINTTYVPPAPTFILTLNRRETGTGENVYATMMAPANTSVRVEVCPNRPGFVECSTAANYQNHTAFPLEAQLPFTNQEGSYLVDAYFINGQYIQTKTEHYNVTSTIVIDIDAPSKPRIHTPILFEASATGGLGKLNYTWYLSNGEKIYKTKSNITYTSPGNYTNRINITDEYGNSREKIISLEVAAAYNTKIIVKDANTGIALKDASVDIDGQKQDTNSNGEATIYVKAGEKHIVISKQNYSIYTADIQVNADNTITVQLTPNQLIKPKPIITLTYPENGQTIVGTKTEVGFKVEHALETNCSIYISEQPSGFFTYLGTAQIGASDKNERRFEIVELDATTYYWNIECSDKSQSSATSETRNFIARTDGTQPAQTVQPTANDPRVNQIENVIVEIESMSPELKETVESLGLKKQVEDANRALKNSARDLDGLNYKNLEGSALEVERQKIISKADEAYNNAPVSFTLLSSENFVDYIDEADLEPLAEEILKITLGEDKKFNMKSIMKNLIAMQQEVVTSTKVRTIKISYASGAEKTITAIIRDVKTYNLSQDTYFVESIPKQVAESASQILSPSEFQIIKEDPIIAFPISKDTKIAYYVEKEVSADYIRSIRTAIFAESVATQPDHITGFSISSITSGIEASPLTIIIIIAVLAVAVFGTFRYEGHKAAQYAMYLARKNETTHYVNVIVSDIENNLEAGNLAKAVELYAEAKHAYSDLPKIAKNDVYDKIAEIARKIEDYQASIISGNATTILAMVSQAESHISSGQLTEAIQQYKTIEKAFHELDDHSKETVHPQIASLGNKIQILIASNTG